MSGAAPPRLLEPDEPPPVEVVQPLGTAGLVLVCDHASNRIPRRLASLGLGCASLAAHIAWDPGAAAVARALAARLDAPLVLGGYSRLVIDLNRPLSSPESIPEHSAGVPIPGNRNLPAADRRARIDQLFQPYHLAIAELLAARAKRSQPTLLLSLHSFTPQLEGRQRPWQVGVAHGRDRRLADRLRPLLAHDGDLLVGDNQPYAVEDEFDYTLPIHGEGNGIPHVLLEIRQDCLTSAGAISVWVERLVDVCRRLETGPGPA